MQAHSAAKMATNALKALEGISEACYVLDDQWRFTLMNSSSEALLGASQEDYLGRNIWEAFPRLEELGVRARFEQALQSGQPVSFSLQYPGRSIWYAIRAIPGKHGLLAFLSVDDRPSDIERSYRALVENAMDGITLVDENLRPFYRSPPSSGILGYPLDEGVPLRAMPAHPDDLPHIRAAAKALAPSETTNLEFRIRHADGSWRWLLGTLTNRLDDPAIRGIVINYRDITEKKRLRDESAARQIELAESNRQLRLRVERLATLHRVHLTTATHRGYGHSIGDILSSALADTPAIALVYARSDGELNAVGVHGPAAAVASLPESVIHRLVERSLSTLTTVTVDTGGPGSDSDAGQLAAAGVRGVHAVPFVRGSINGALVLLAPGKMHRDLESGSYLAILTGYIANALETTKLLDDLKRSSDNYSALARFGQEIETITDIDELAAHGLQQLLRQPGIDYATLASVENGFAIPRWRAGLASPENEELLRRPIPLQQGVVGQAVATGESVLVQDYLSFRHRPEYLHALRFTSVLALPFDAGSSGRFVFIMASRHEQRQIDETTVAVADLFAKRMANAFERVGYLDEVKATREGTFRALGLALEYRDYETKGHTDRVVSLTDTFGQTLGFDSTHIQALRWGAYLHDLGKLSIPDQILLKQGPLTDSEFQLIRQHPLTGEEICRDVGFLPKITHEIVRHHHEKWDGTGYPDQLAGKDIPLEARVFAIVDVYDALTSDRPYRSAWSEELALAHMESQAGIHFDPELLEKFLELVRQPEAAART